MRKRSERSVEATVYIVAVVGFSEQRQCLLMVTEARQNSTASAFNML